MQDYLESRKEIDRLTELTAKLARAAFDSGVKELFDNNSDLESFTWHQYEPFNDGDPTVFRVSIDEDVITINEYGEEDLDSGEDYVKTGNKDKWGCLEYVCQQNREPSAAYLSHKKLAPLVSNFLSAFDVDDMETMFGNGYEITFRRGVDEPEIDDYYNG